MAEVFISFKAETSTELKEMIEAWLGGPSTQVEREAAGFVEAPSDPKLKEDAATLSDEDYDAKHGNGEDVEPAPEPEPPAKRTRAPRAPRVSAAPAPAPAQLPPAPALDLPPLDTLKAAVTSAVRLAQKGEGSKTILDLLPAFKDTTGLTFVMNAEDKHRGALYDLVQAAGLPVV